MPVESAEDLAGFFDPDEFADQEPMIATIDGLPVPFNGIYSQGHIAENPNTTANITATVPRIITPKAALPGLLQGNQIERANGEVYVVNDIQHKADLIVIYLHDVW